MTGPGPAAAAAGYPAARVSAAADYDWCLWDSRTFSSMG